MPAQPGDSTSVVTARKRRIKKRRRVVHGRSRSHGREQEHVPSQEADCASLECFPPPAQAVKKLVLSNAEGLSVAEIKTEADRIRGQLVDKWKHVGKPRGRASPEVAPEFFANTVFNVGLERWLQDRNLWSVLERVSDWHPPAEEIHLKRKCQYFRFKPWMGNAVSLLTQLPNRERVYHGTWWYALWLILRTGLLLESDIQEGQESSAKSVPCCSRLEEAFEHARPHSAFGDGIYNRVVLELVYDPDQVKSHAHIRKNDILLPGNGVAISAVVFQPNSPVVKGEQRVDCWHSELEAIPTDCSIPARSAVDEPIPKWMPLLDARPQPKLDRSAASRIIRHHARNEDADKSCPENMSESREGHEAQR
eukprot:TRINITY_DN74205_c0_g1_i1.p1 TRINITY_DN74205_c0_g1~~TRINITY_DN74205_c0_g1_i1.p1  ORF type:complete len:365 (-),score=47.44 TRINITY_DN74205_c0_g1_i1:269-1363(-)